MKLLHIDASPLGTHSVSRELTAATVKELKQNHSGIEVTYRDLTTQSLPHWAPVADANSAGATLGQAVMDEFLAADVIVIGAPIYNFSIPSQLKAWIDRIVVAGTTFRYGANGPEGLAGGKRVIIASTRGGMYGTDSGRAAMDFQEPYLRAVLGFIGITDIEFVRAEGIAFSDEHKKQALASAHATIDGLVSKAA